MSVATARKRMVRWWRADSLQEKGMEGRPCGRRTVAVAAVTAGLAGEGRKKGKGRRCLVSYGPVLFGELVGHGASVLLEAWSSTKPS